MHFKVESSGCCERKGYVQIRLSMYLDEQDYGYDKHHVQVPIIPKDGFPGKIEGPGVPVDIEEYKKWMDALPKEWINNPFHNHFIYTEPNITDEEILRIGEQLTKDSYILWEQNKILYLVNEKVNIVESIPGRVLACETKVAHLKTAILEKVI